MVMHQDNESAIRLVSQEAFNRQVRSKFKNRSLFQVKDNIEINIDRGEIIVIHERTTSIGEK